MKDSAIIVGYSGHAFVVLDILINNKHPIIGYCDSTEKTYNPYNLKYLGKETDENPLSILKLYSYFVGIGDNSIRAKVSESLIQKLGKIPINAIHLNAVCSNQVQYHTEGGILVAANATINPFTEIGKGAICNTSCSIDHECIIGDYAHIAPGAVLCGNVKVGEKSFIGANAVIKQGITIGKNVMVGAGSVVIKNLPDGVTAYGNPAKIIRYS